MERSDMGVRPFSPTSEIEQVMDGKYVVFKTNDLFMLLGELALPPGATWYDRDTNCAALAELITMRVKEEAVPDAVVIRRQDIFAAPALEAYANAITCVIDVLSNQSDPSGKTKDLRDIADYFHEQAEKSYDGTRKLPD